MTRTRTTATQRQRQGYGWWERPCGRGTKSRDRCPAERNQSRDFHPVNDVTFNFRALAGVQQTACHLCNSEKSPCCRGRIRCFRFCQYSTLYWEGSTRYNMMSSFAKCVFQRVLVSLKFMVEQVCKPALSIVNASPLHNRLLGTYRQTG